MEHNIMKSKKVLFVDDQKDLLDILGVALEDEPYTCLFATSGIQALEILSQHNVQVIVTDMRMPEMDGLSLLKLVRKQYPNVVRIVLSGHIQIPILLTAINEGNIYKFITKPWRMDEDFKPLILEAIELYDKIAAVNAGQAIEVF
jgi:two-component system, NtrC family, response regulator HupR/HoxA